MGFFKSMGRAVSGAVNRLPGGNALSRGARRMGGGALGIQTRSTSGQNQTMSGDRSARGGGITTQRSMTRPR